jgi:hypothetical protein
MKKINSSNDDFAIKNKTSEQIAPVDIEIIPSKVSIVNRYPVLKLAPMAKDFDGDEPHQIDKQVDSTSIHDITIYKEEDFWKFLKDMLISIGSSMAYDFKPFKESEVEIFISAIKTGSFGKRITEFFRTGRGCIDKTIILFVINLFIDEMDHMMSPIPTNYTARYMLIGLRKLMRSVGDNLSSYESEIVSMVSKVK